MANLLTETIKGLPEATGKVGKAIGGFLISPLKPLGEDIAELLVLKEYERKFDNGEIAPETFAAVSEEMEITKKTAPQIIGDVAQVVLMGTPIKGGVALNQLSKTAPTIKMLVGQGIKTGAQIGAAFGVAGQLSAEPKVEAGKVAGAAVAGGALGAGLGGILGAITPYLGKAIGKEVKLPAELPQDLAGTTQEINRITSKAKIKEPGLEKYVLSPELVFKQMGDEVWENVGKPLLKTQDTLQHKVYAGSQVIKSLQKELGTSFLQKTFNKNKYTQTSERIFDWLNNEVKPRLEGKELSVATKIKQIFDNYADRLDAMRQAEGLTPINRRVNYITNLINEEVKSVIGREGSAENMNQLIFNNIPREVFDPFLLAREGKLPIQKDVWKALRAYTAITERKLTFDPVLKQIDANLKKLPTNSGVKEYTKWFVNHLLGRPSDLETAMVNTTNRFLGLFGKKNVSFPIALEEGVLEMEAEVSKLSVNRISPIIGKVKLMNYLSFIGSNLRTMLVNLTQPVGLVANLPINPMTTLVNMVRGYAIATTKLFSKNGWQEMADKGIIQEFTNLMETEFSARSVLSDILMWNMRISEFVNRVASTYAGKITFQQMAKKAGFDLAEQEAIALGKELSNIVNFKYGVGQIPRMFANPIGQLYYQYMTFVLKQGELLGNMASKLPKKNMIPDFVKAMEEGKGVDWLMTYESPERLAFLKYWLYVGVLATALQQTGFKIWDTFTKGFIPNQLEALPQLVEGIWEGNTDKIQTSLGKMAAFPAISKGWKGLVPLRTQAQRTLQFIEAWKTGQITDANQKVIEKEVAKEEAFRRFLMGTYGTAEGQQRADTFTQITDLKTKYSEYRTEAFNIALNEHNIPKANHQISEYNKELTTFLRKILREGKIKINPQQFLTLVKLYTINPITPQLLIEERMRRNTPSIERFLGVSP